MDDVGAIAGVSRMTVSRVLNGGRNVSPGAAEAVHRAIRKTGYVVNQHARSLVTQRSQSVAFILTEPQDRGREIRAYMRDPDGHLIEVGQIKGIPQ